MKLLYLIVYNSIINRLLRNLFSFWNGMLPFNYELPVSGIVRMPIPKGNIRLSTNQTSFVSKVIYYRGWENFEYSRFFYKLIPEMSSFMDIGSNIGYYSILAGICNPSCKITAFEPAPGPLHFLKNNVRLNKLKNVRVEDIALSDSNGYASFQIVKSKKYNGVKYNLSGEHNLGCKNSKKHFDSVDVETITLDDYVSSRNIANIDLIKMDTEGNEHLILRKGLNSINQFRPIVICETLFNSNEEDLESIFKNFDYSYYRHHSQKKLEKVTSLERDFDDGVRDCFFVPNEKTEWFEQLMEKVI